MIDEHDEIQEPHGLLGSLLAPLRAPQRLVTDIETIATALLGLQRDAGERLASIDDRAGRLIREVESLRAPLERVDRKVTELQKLERAITSRMDALQEDLNTRLLSVEAEVRGMRPSLDQMARDVQSLVQLLPKPSDGPLARLKDTLTPS